METLQLGAKVGGKSGAFRDRMSLHNDTTSSETAAKSGEREVCRHSEGLSSAREAAHWSVSQKKKDFIS